MGLALNCLLISKRFRIRERVRKTKTPVQPKPNGTQPIKEPASSTKAAEPKEDTALAKMILDKMPEFNPEWKEETQKSWIDTISKLMDRLEKKSGN